MFKTKAAQPRNGVSRRRSQTADTSDGCFLTTRVKKRKHIVSKRCGKQASEPLGRYSFTPRSPGRSFAARGGLKEWPDEWRCKACAWCANYHPGMKWIYCRAWNRSMWANSDRACFEETGEMKMERDLAAMRAKNMFYELP